ncbi:MAG TPA: hypothetical protein ENG61_01155 [Candidatus Korarchaeota archaeon]|nr:hypothetical protein [Candidatus Korarchaeota archaeon]
MAWPRPTPPKVVPIRGPSDLKRELKNVCEWLGGEMTSRWTCRVKLKELSGAERWVDIEVSGNVVSIGDEKYHRVFTIEPKAISMFVDMVRFIGDGKELWVDKLGAMIGIKI